MKPLHLDYGQRDHRDARGQICSGKRSKSARVRLGRADVRATLGSVLVIVLVTLLFASVAVVAFIEQASNDLLVESRAAAARRLRQEAYSTLEVTLATLQGFVQADNGLHHPGEGWDTPLEFADWKPREGCTAVVTFEDESGKIPLPRVDAATLVSVFESWKLSPPDAERLADALLSWMRKDYVPARGLATDYDQRTIPYNVPARSLRSYSELAAIDDARDVFYDEQGRPNDLWRRFVATFSLFDYQQVNLNSASPEVLQALGFSEPAQQQRLGEYLAGTGANAALGPRWLSSSSDAMTVLGSGALPPLAGMQIRALRVNILMREGGSVFRLTAVVAPSGGATLVQSTATSATSPASGAATSPSAAPVTPPPQLNYPFTLLEIRENAEMPAVPPAA